jgi:hypothetical protein
MPRLGFGMSWTGSGRRRATDRETIPRCPVSVSTTEDQIQLSTAGQRPEFSRRSREGPAAGGGGTGFWGWAAPLLITLFGGFVRFWRLEAHRG